MFGIWLTISPTMIGRTDRWSSGGGPPFIENDQLRTHAKYFRIDLQKKDLPQEGLLA
jgi:hypothetical protein